MKTVSISVTEASRNFADCVNRARYQGTTFILHKNGSPVARLVPEECKPVTGKDLAAALHRTLDGAHLGPDEAKDWLRELKAGRRAAGKPANRWPS
ncbi:MAG TPA: type II toxin-antitoxin system prevent-host-death family antitoxin [Terracidiphilus sp.]|jgi:prevent-host-death family protein|nr:type II toxin-antitoxin system prevent-host-death family antitoxin [Terracidiphilus sp.]